MINEQLIVYIDKTVEKQKIFPINQYFMFAISKTFQRLRSGWIIGKYLLAMNVVSKNVTKSYLMYFFLVVQPYNYPIVS